MTTQRSQLGVQMEPVEAALRNQAPTMVCGHGGINGLLGSQICPYSVSLSRCPTPHTVGTPSEMGKQLTCHWTHRLTGSVLADG